MRVQFSVDAAQWQKLQNLAQANGYPDVPTYCKDIALEERTYGMLWNKVTSKIKAMPSGQTFALRDLITTPPANLGVKLFENQKTLSIKVNDKKDNLNTNTYTKL